MRAMLLLMAATVTASAQTATHSFYNERGQFTGQDAEVPASAEMRT